MRIRWIVIAVSAALAVGGLSAYAGNSHGATVSPLATTTTSNGQLRGEADSDLASNQQATAQSTTPKAKVEAESEENESAACEATESAVAALRAADRGEDKTEHAAAATSSKSADRAEDKTEHAAAEAARDAVQAACRPTLSAACKAAIEALKDLRAADKVEDQAEVKPTTDAARAADKIEDAAERQAHRAAVQAVRAACAGQR